MKQEYDTRFNGLQDAFWIVHKISIGSTISTPTEAKRKLRKILKQNECDDSFIDGINDDIATGFAVAVNIIKNAIADNISKTEEHGTAEKPMTNADKIRAMTDEELAAVLHGMCVGVIMCADCFAKDNCPVDKGLTWEEWLKQPADDDC